MRTQSGAKDGEALAYEEIKACYESKEEERQPFDDKEDPFRRNFNTKDGAFMNMNEGNSSAIQEFEI